MEIPIEIKRTKNGNFNKKIKVKDEENDDAEKEIIDSREIIYQAKYKKTWEEISKNDWLDLQRYKWIIIKSNEKEQHYKSGRKKKQWYDT